MQNALWRAELAALDRTWIEVEFADVLGDTPGTLRRIAAFAGIDLNPDRLPESSPTVAQSEASGRDATVLRYAADRRRTGALRRLPARFAARLRGRER